MLLAGAIIFGLYKLLQLYYHSQVKFEDFERQIRYFIREVGDVNFFLIFFVPLAILFFFLLTKRYANYFREISNGIRNLANGEFDKRVTVSTKDEFGEIAADINAAGEKLMEAVTRGDFAESSKDQLVLNLAHDLRTPLTSVIGYLDFILKDKDLPQEQVRHFTSIAFAKSQRLEKLIDELFEITRMSHGMLKSEKHPIDLGELLVQMNEELFPLFEKSHLETRLHLTSSLIIEADGDLLARVFENLLTNAVRYGSDGKYVDIHAYLDASEVVVQIINYGDAIPPEEIPHLFEMFYTGDKSRTHREGSTGLGLFISKNIVTQHNGTISADSNLIRTLFEVRLPQAEAN